MGLGPPTFGSYGRNQPDEPVVVVGSGAGGAGLPDLVVGSGCFGCGPGAGVLGGDWVEVVDDIVVFLLWLAVEIEVRVV